MDIILVFICVMVVVLAAMVLIPAINEFISIFRSDDDSEEEVGE